MKIYETPLKFYGKDKYRTLLDSLIELNERDSTIHHNVSHNHKADKNGNQNYNTSFDSTRFDKSKIKSSTTIPIVKIKIVELNTADSFELEEVYGLQPQKYMDINHLVKANADLIHKIYINNVNEKTLATHPYTGRKMASILMRYKKTT